MTPKILREIVATTHRSLASSPPDRRRLERLVENQPPAHDALAILRKAGRHIIAEVKRKSPSAGTIHGTVNPVTQAQHYASAGASAISVLTDSPYFGGSLTDLEAVSRAVSQPTLRKDFIVDEIQLLEARAYGASLVLLIAAILSDAELVALRRASDRLGLTALVETHTQNEVKRAVNSGATLIGVNSRDLNSFSVDLTVAERLRPSIPAHIVAVAESGIETSGDVVRLSQAGYEVFLIGSCLMRASDPSAALSVLLEA